jgi:hypothetical protein
VSSSIDDQFKRTVTEALVQCVSAIKEEKFVLSDRYPEAIADKLQFMPKLKQRTLKGLLKVK